MVRVNGKWYCDTGRESTVSGCCGNMDGEITLTVDGTKIPMEDNQPDFKLEDCEFRVEGNDTLIKS